MSAKGLILEGISGTGKTTLYRRLLQHPAFVAWEAKIALSEAFTERAIEDVPDRTLETSLDLLSDITGMLGGLARRWSEGKFSNNPAMAPAFILERFHLTHAVMYNNGRFQDYRRVDELMRFLGTKLVLCVAGADELPEQRQFREMAEASYLSTLVIDTTRGDWQMYEEQIVHFWDLA